jgi:hypothetical protein
LTDYKNNKIKQDFSDVVKTEENEIDESIRGEKSFMNRFKN